MVRGIYTGASGMVAQMHRMDAISNNLANVDLAGYKRDQSVSKAFPQMLMRRMNDDGVYTFPFGSAETAPVLGTVGTGVEYNESYTVFSQGALQQTGNDFDLALDGKGFFTIQSPEGERLSRNGSFHLSKEGVLTTKDGLPVLGEQGVIKIKKNNFVVDEAGRVWQNGSYGDDPRQLVSKDGNEWENLEMVDTLKIVNVRRPRFLKKQGDSLYLKPEEAGPSSPADLGGATKLVQGFIEGSNVNSVSEMVRMIEVNRVYEANQKSITTHDNLTAKLINDAIKV